MEIVTSWERRASQRETVTMVLRQLNLRVGALTPHLQERIQQLLTPQLEDLGEALLDFSAIADLETTTIRRSIYAFLFRHPLSLNSSDRITQTTLARGEVLEITRQKSEQYY